MQTLPEFDVVVAGSGAPPPGARIGASVAGASLSAYRLGTGDRRISLIAGCHADEPVGPIFLDRLVRFLATQPASADILTRFTWWIVPDVNPDGAQKNRAWTTDVTTAYDLAAYLGSAARELPGDDIEFGFPRDRNDNEARPENRAVVAWWQSDLRPFVLHVSLHGMAVAGGPWFLIDPDWSERCDILMRRCRDVTRTLGFELHDVQRNGEKGFTRIARGFATRPNSKAMAKYFIERNDPTTAARFRPSSMETVRTFGGDALTLVSEAPLFVLPGVGEQITPSDAVAASWRERLAEWRERLRAGERPEIVRREAAAAGVMPVPVTDQMHIQWEMIRAGVEQATST